MLSNLPDALLRAHPRWLWIFFILRLFCPSGIEGCRQWLNTGLSFNLFFPQ